MLMRQTKVSKAVLAILKLSHRPLSVANILELLEKKNLSPNKTTIYRLLDKLSEQGEVTKLLLQDGSSHYEKKGHHHHHFVCNSCHEVFCLNSCHLESSNSVLFKALPNKNFKIKSHELNLYGTCDSCSDTNLLK